MKKVDLSRVKHIHFVGIKGVGMAPLAIYAKEAGVKVTGSDIDEVFITDEPLAEKGVSWSVGFAPDTLPKDTDLVIATGAHGGMENPQVQKARLQGIPVFMQGEALGLFMQGHTGVAVAGSHGKTTTAAMLATLLASCGLDPSFAVGCGSMRPLGPSGHKGKGEYFVAEADEYANEPNLDKTPKFLYLAPKIIILTNIDFDHPDIFANLEQLTNAFMQFCQKLPKDSTLIANGDDAYIQKILPLIDSRKVTFGNGVGNDFRIRQTGTIPGKTTFFVEHKNVGLGEFTISIPGNHNAVNALGVIAAGLELGLPVEKIRTNLPLYLGAKRRLEYIGEIDGTMVFDDYAHHPKEIQATLSSLRLWYPKAWITVIFQPHTYSRTKALFTDFVHAFSNADEVIITDIYPSLREEKDPGISSKMLIDEMKKIGIRATFVSTAQEVVQYIANRASKKQSEIIITMGAGDIYKIASAILQVKN